MTRSVALIRDRLVGSAALDVALSKAMLGEVSEGRQAESLRIYRASDALAFSTLDRNRSGFRKACDIAAGIGFEPILRLAGGQAAVFTDESVAFAWIIPAEDPRTQLRQRFDEASTWIRSALGDLGFDARVGEIPGEYCPGKYSVNLRGKVKVMGVGQRIVRGAAHVGGVVCVSRTIGMKNVLTPVYETLGYSLNPETIGSLSDDSSDIDVESVMASLIDSFRSGASLYDEDLQEPVVKRARSIEIEHRANVSSVSSGYRTGSRNEKAVFENLKG